MSPETTELPKTGLEVDARRAAWFPLFSYRNWGPSAKNTCGQAALATLADFYGRDGIAEKARLRRTLDPEDVQPDEYFNRWMRDEKQHYPSDDFVGEINKRLPPDEWTPFGHVSTERTMTAALDKLGIGQFEFSPENGDARIARRELEQFFVQDKKLNRRQPVLVLLDMGPLWSTPFVLHWGVVHGTAPEGVLIGSWHASDWHPWDRFMEAWKCHFLPWGHLHYYSIRTRRL